MGAPFPELFSVRREFGDHGMADRERASVRNAGRNQGQGSGNLLPLRGPKQGHSAGAD
jgi:hypothetical protein